MRGGRGTGTAAANRTPLTPPLSRRERKFLSRRSALPRPSPRGRGGTRAVGASRTTGLGFELRTPGLGFEFRPSPGSRGSTCAGAAPPAVILRSAATKDLLSLKL